MKNKNELEKDPYQVEWIRDSLLNGIVHFVYLLLPVAMAFLGYFCSSAIWDWLFADLGVCPQWFSFVVSLSFFAVICVVILVKTRNTNPVHRIRVSK